MLQHLGTCNAAFLVDVTNNKDRQPLLLGHSHNPHGAFLDLAQAARSGADLSIGYRLNGIDNYNIRS